MAIPKVIGETPVRVVAGGGTCGTGGAVAPRSTAFARSGAGAACRAADEDAAWAIDAGTATGMPNFDGPATCRFDLRDGPAD
jgi:hypothetical protein